MFTTRRRLSTAISLLLLVAVAFAGCGWPQARYGPDQTGFNPFERAISPANVSQLRMRWSQYTHSHRNGTAPPVIADGTLYIGTDKLYAFDASSGSARWSSAALGVAQASPAVADGVVYVNGDKLYAFDATTGDARWSRPVGSPAHSPAIANGVVYISSDKLYALDAATGTTLWSASVGPDAGHGSPAIANGVVYVSRDRLYALNAATGSQRWTAEISPTQPPAVADDIVYVGGGSSRLFALSAATGTQLWSKNVNVGSPAAIANGAVYVSGDKLYALDAATGSQRWSVVSCCGGVPIVANGVLYVGSDRLNGYDAATGKSLWSANVSGTAPVIAGGVVYFGDTTLSAYGLPDAAPQLSISPAFPIDVTFGDSSSTVRTFAITNVGSTSTSPIADSLSGPDAAKFRISTDSCTGVSLAGGARCTVTASFAPTRSGPHVARLTSTASAGGTVSALLAGNALPFSVAVTKPFDSVFVSSTSTAVFTVTNLTGVPVGPLTNTMTTASEISIAADTCAQKTIASGASCTITAQFAPTWSTEYSGSVTTQAPGQKAEAFFTATGLSRLRVTPSSKGFGTVTVGAVTSTTFTVTNISTTSAGPIADGILKYGGLTWLSLGSDSCAARTLAASTTCTIVVRYAPTAPFPDLPLGVLQISAPLAGAASASLSGGAGA